ncbi:unnamed protein product [Cochlearia groenlandica]
MDDDDDNLWGPPLLVKDDTLHKQTLRRYEFWFDCRTDVLEENFQNQMYCEQVWRILNEKKKTKKKKVDLVLSQDDVASSGSGDSLDVASCVPQDKTLKDGDTSSAKSALDEEDENTSSISDAQTTETKDSTNNTEETDQETRVTPEETAVNNTIIVEVAENADTSFSPVLASKIEEAEEHSCSSLVTDQVFDPIKKPPREIFPSAAIIRENVEGSALMALVLETTKKVKEKANATNIDGEILTDHQQIDILQDIVTASEPFTTESLLEMCDEPHKVRETTFVERSKRPQLEPVKTVVKDERIVTLLAEARKKAQSNALLSPGSVMIKKRPGKSNNSNSKGIITTNFIRNTKQKVQGEAGKIFPVKNSTQSTPTQLSDSTLALIERIRQRRCGDGEIKSVSVTSISELKNKRCEELRIIAKELKITHYYKLKKEDLLQKVLEHLKLTDCTNQKMES